MLSKEQRIKNTILILIMLILISAGFIISIYDNHLIKTHISEDMQEKNRHINKVFNLFINDMDREISQRTDKMLCKEARKEFFNQNRDALYKLVKDDYEDMIKSNSFLKIVTFRLPDGSAFLRVHKPEMYGDSLNTKRKIIIDTITTQKRQFGFELGKLRMTHRVVTPIFYNDTFVGVVEIGIEPEYIIEKMNNLFDIKSSLFVKDGNLEVSLDKNLENRSRVGNFIFARGSNIIKDNLNQIDLSKNSFRILFQNREYHINVIDLLDHKGNVAAKILVYYDLTKENEEFSSLMKKNLIAIFLVIFMLFIVLNIGLNYFLKKIDQLYLNVLKKDKMMLQQSKLASMGEMIGNIAHQWRQPLSVISTSASGLRLQNELKILDDEQLNNSVECIVNSTKYLSQTIDDFISFVKNSQDAVEFDIKENLEKNLGILKGSLKIHEVNVFLDSQNKIIKGFPNELTQVFINIVHNAKDALKSNTLNNRLVFVSTISDENSIKIIIKDNAGGIPEDIMSKIFDPYFTTKGDSDGTGLGLYMSYRIINENMGGSIKVENIEYEYEGKVHKGAQFSITLPIT
ncbi:ATP-binding protein [Halarcobacter ebronensis]|uniref:histidine kinase n=1 Tax=Halarcobacter ebronensis TaxID=1462615 RepID=A0A4Q1AL86_9BACT|nr:ATP-binding protein [Halarcobacter ebronensis]QKF81472.1 Cache sensor-containing signal transduction histidine kinase [Halarcobacter ebronensis]RXK02466.1 hypothetical protein CRV07_13430 [Halarcobacter ebronensis]